jgi:hypothetical protein
VSNGYKKGRKKRRERKGTHLEEAKLGHAKRHPRPSPKGDSCRSCFRLEPAYRVLHVLLDLVGGFETEQSEIAQKVVLQGQEL